MGVWVYGSPGVVSGPLPNGFLFPSSRETSNASRALILSSPRPLDLLLSRDLKEELFVSL